MSLLLGSSLIADPAKEVTPGPKVSNPDPAPKGDPKVEAKVEVKSKPRPFSLQGEVKSGGSTIGATAALCPDGKLAALIAATPGTTNNSVAVWDFRQRKVIGRMIPEGQTNRVVWSDDALILATLEVGFGEGEKAPELAIWDTISWEKKAAFKMPRYTGELAISADGKIVASACAGPEGYLRVIDVVDKKLLINQDLRTPKVELDLSQDGKLVVVSGYGKMANQIALIEVATGQIRTSWKGKADALKLTRDGKLMALAETPAHDAVVTIWDLATEKSIRAIDIGRLRAQTLAFLDGNKYLAVGGSTDEVYVYEIETGTLVQKFTPAEKRGTISLSTNPTETHLLTFSGDFVARLWTVPFSKKK